HVGQDVGRMSWMHAATWDEPLRIFLHISRYELIDCGREANYLRRNVVDEYSAIDADAVEISKKSLGRAAILGHLIEVLARPLHQGQRFRLKQLHGLDVDVAVGDHLNCSTPGPLVWQIPALSRGDIPA